MQNHIKIISVFLAIFLHSAFSSYPWCSPECECSIINGVRTHNHAKCSNVNGILENKHHPLHSLDLSNTNLTKLPHLEKLRDLIMLDVSKNLLSDIDHLGRRIKILNLSHNKITSAKLENIPIHVEHLNLSYNDITYLPLELTKLSKLKSIEVVGNTINCTCETLEVRNWMQTQHVWTDNHIKCTYPVKIKGMPWLQVKQSDICDEKKIDEDTGDTSQNDDNELMLGDQPFVDEGSAEKDADDELSTDYLPFKENHISIDDAEGSGSDLGVKMLRLQSNIVQTTEAHHEDDKFEGSGSGAKLFSGDAAEKTSTSSSPDIITDDDVVMTSQSPRISDISFDKDLTTDDDLMMSPSPDISDTSFDKDLTTDDDLMMSQSPSISDISFDKDVTTVDDIHIPQPDDVTTPTADIFVDGHLGIYGQSSDDSSVTEVTSLENEGKTENGIEGMPGVTEEVIVPVVQYGLGTENVAPNVDNVSKSDNLRIDEELKAGGDDSSLHILMAIIGVIIVTLIVIVIYKRISKPHQTYDPENPRSTEMKNMDRKNLGKPLQGNGHNENKPLITGNDQNNKPLNGNIIPYNEMDKKTQEPLLNDNVPESNNNIETPVPAIRQTLTNSPNTTIAQPEPSPRTYISRYGPYPPPKSPASARPSSPSSDEDGFKPNSPLQRRYSPVYSPDTGKVKIKLTETPKPKTPMLVTRSVSNAGDIITMPTEIEESK